jgi:SprT-like family
MNREEWLMNATARLSQKIVANGGKMPDVRVSVGFPKSSGRNSNNVIGQCFNGIATTDGRPQIFIHPVLDDSKRVLDVLLHELIHGVMELGEGHGKNFARLAKACGLTGKMTATIATPELNQELDALISEIGEYPHAKLDASNARKQSTRMIKCECEECGYIAYTSRKWLDAMGAPFCPEHGQMWQA